MNPSSRSAKKRRTSRRTPISNKISVYEAAKAAWDKAHPGADYRTRDQAMLRIAREAGV